MSGPLRPKQMSKVSVTGSKAVMEDVVGVVHEMNLLHVTEYDGSWEGFEPGDPVEGADELAEKLVTVRSLESILDVEADDADRDRVVTDEDLEEDLEGIRQRVNELDDRKETLEDELREVEDGIEAMAPFAELGVDLDLLQGYDSLQVSVGEGDEAAVRRALEAADDLEVFELFTGDGVVAAFARPTEDAPEDALEEALVGVDFAAIEVPDLEAGPVEIDAEEPSPEAYLAALRSRRDEIEAELDAVEADLAAEKEEAAGFLLAVEEKLSIDVQKHEAPLSFATTSHSFVAEGWLPTERYDEFADAVVEAVDGHVEVEELERADYDGEGHPEPESVERTEPGAAAADGGTTLAEDPPVIQDNPDPAKPFELLTEMVALPRYDEFDPTMVLWLTFPVFFGFMIGDIGYGLLYMGIGYWLWSRFDSDAIRSLGGVALWAGGFTVLFGVLYGEFLGLHWPGKLYGGPVMHKGLSPAEIEYAIGWIVLTAVVGVLHVTLGYTLAFLKELRHGLDSAVLESGSWMLMMWGLWAWIFSNHLGSAKPGFLVGSESVFNGHPLPLGFAGFPTVVGLLGVVAFVVGVAMIFYADPVEGVEAVFLQVLVRGLSYTRIAAVLLAKAGMAFVVNLLVFGAYSEATGHGAEFHFLYFSEKTATTLPEEATLIFGGLLNATGPVELAVGVIGGVLIFVIGHLIVLGLGVTSAGLQAVRLEYVEFFQEFYEGGGDPYEPFGHERQFTTED